MPIHNFRVEVPAAGTAVPLTDGSPEPNRYGVIIVQALEGNDNVVVLGGPDVLADAGTRNGVYLVPGGTFVITPERGTGITNHGTRSWYIDAVTNDDGVTVTVVE